MTDGDKGMKKIERTPVSNFFVAVRISDLDELEQRAEFQDNLLSNILTDIDYNAKKYLDRTKISEKIIKDFISCFAKGSEELYLASFNEMICLQDATTYMQEQKTKIDALKDLNPEVPCPECNDHENEQMICVFCMEKGKVPLTKSQEYRIKELEELLQLHRENDKIAGAME